MFKRYSGKTKVMWFEKDTGVEVRAGGLVVGTDSGTVRYAQNDSVDKVLGVALKNDTTTDSSMIPVEVPVERAVEWVIDLDSDGGATDTDIFRFAGVDTTGGGSVSAGDSCATRLDISDSASGHVFVTKRVSATQVIGVLANTAWDQSFDT